MSLESGRREMIIGEYQSTPRKMMRHHELDTSPRIGQCSQAQLNTSTPCAACKLLRRRCIPECPFSPYFSPHEPQKFASVHKVFGASNVSKMLMEVPEKQRADAANSLVYQANVRLRDPVYGCMGVISALQQEAQALQAEINAVRGKLVRYRYEEIAAAVVALPTASTQMGSLSNSSTERTISTHSSQATPPTDYTFSSPASTIADHVKERYWSLLNLSCS